MLFNLDLANNTILSCFFFLFLVTDSYFLIAVVTGHLYNLIAEPKIPIGMPTKEAKSETEIHPVIVEPRIRQCSV